jgi:hypothetical protein
VMYYPSSVSLKSITQELDLKSYVSTPPTYC